jgi:hypothetical protein
VFPITKQVIKNIEAFRAATFTCVPAVQQKRVEVQFEKQAGRMPAGCSREMFTRWEPTFQKCPSVSNRRYRIRKSRS